MYNRVFSAVALTVFLGATSILAQTVASVGGPAELPPKGFKGQQFVDSRGCVYLKAGLSGQINWVLRVGSDRKPMCNQTPTFGPKPVIEVATAEEMVVPAVVEAAPAAQPAVKKPAAASAVAPVEKTPKAASLLVAPAPDDALNVAAAPAKAQVSGEYETASNGNGTGKIGCFTSAPMAERVKLRNGGTAVVCTRGDGTLSGWRSPIYSDGAGVGASLSNPPVAFLSGGTGGIKGNSGGNNGGSLVDAGTIHVPEGYKLAWKDDRLNPLRGKGTAQGQADQDQVWTRDVPAVAVVASTKKSGKKGVAASTSAADQPSTKPSASTKSVGGAGQTFIMVGSYGVPSNADGAASTLKALGLPVARAKVNRGGKALQIVLAGPFASASEAKSALGAVRGAGFDDAFVK